MCTVLLPPDVNPTAANKDIISYISYQVRGITPHVETTSVGWSVTQHQRLTEFPICIKFGKGKGKLKVQVKFTLEQATKAQRGADV
jgi:hypothetical protein